MKFFKRKSRTKEITGQMIRENDSIENVHSTQAQTSTRISTSVARQSLNNLPLSGSKKVLAKDCVAKTIDDIQHFPEFLFPIQPLDITSANRTHLDELQRKECMKQLNALSDIYDTKLINKQLVPIPETLIQTFNFPLHCFKGDTRDNFTIYTLYQRHINPSSNVYFRASTWKQEMVDLEFKSYEEFFRLTGAKSYTVYLSQETTANASHSIGLGSSTNTGVNAEITSHGMNESNTSKTVLAYREFPLSSRKTIDLDSPELYFAFANQKFNFRTQAERWNDGEMPYVGKFQECLEELTLMKMIREKKVVVDVNGITNNSVSTIKSISLQKYTDMTIDVAFYTEEDYEKFNDVREKWTKKLEEYKTDMEVSNSIISGEKHQQVAAVIDPLRHYLVTYRNKYKKVENHVYNVNFMLIGPPGSGKSSFVYSALLAEKFRMRCIEMPTGLKIRSTYDNRDGTFTEQYDQYPLFKDQIDLGSGDVGSLVLNDTKGLGLDDQEVQKALKEIIGRFLDIKEVSRLSVESDVKVMLGCPNIIMLVFDGLELIEKLKKLESGRSLTPGYYELVNDHFVTQLKIPYMIILTKLDLIKQSYTQKQMDNLRNYIATEFSIDLNKKGETSRIQFVTNFETKRIDDSSKRGKAWIESDRAFKLEECANEKEFKKKKKVFDTHCDNWSKIHHGILDVLRTGSSLIDQTQAEAYKFLVLKSNS